MVQKLTIVPESHGNPLDIEKYLFDHKVALAFELQDGATEDDQTSHSFTEQSETFIKALNMDNRRGLYHALFEFRETIQHRRHQDMDAKHCTLPRAFSFCSKFASSSKKGFCKHTGDWTRRRILGSLPRGIGGIALS